jgi:hypothetical protein
VQETSALAPWHDFYILVGTASATLVGLLFVTASVGSSYYSRDSHHALRAFLSPSVVHFASVLAACMIGVAPLRNWVLLGLFICALGVFGVVYAGLVWRGMVRHGFSASADLEDRIWYAAMPAIAYAAMLGAGITVFLQPDDGCDLIAVAMGLLLLIGVHNAWDMTIWTIIRRTDTQASQPAQPARSEGDGPREGAE